MRRIFAIHSRLSLTVPRHAWPVNHTGGRRGLAKWGGASAGLASFGGWSRTFGGTDTFTDTFQHMFHDARSVAVGRCPHIVVAAGAMVRTRRR
ncbi:MAG: hypothetical protein KC543_17445 [Myxococcales bacterium]|nr:hypothetical protein [Myxococcales bacterium]